MTVKIEKELADNSPRFIEHQMVTLKAPIPFEGLSEGARGTIVHLYLNGQACEVEFADNRGTRVVTLLLNQVRPKIIGR